MSHGHHHHIDISKAGEKGLLLAIFANLFLTLVQVAGGLIAGSLAVLADALHNFGDACILIMAYIALRIGRLPADEYKTFGYQRAENIAAIISLTSLVLIGLFLMIEAVGRIGVSAEIDGRIMIGVTVAALAVDLWTVYLTHRGAANSSNIRAAFIHNMIDAMTSLGVIIGGVIIYFFGLFWIDIVITILISLYAIGFALNAMRDPIDLLMNAVPAGLNRDEIILDMQAFDTVSDVHHVHIWRIDEDRISLQAHVRVDETTNLDEIKHDLKTLLKKKYSIDHATLELEFSHCCDDDIKT